MYGRQDPNNRLCRLSPTDRVLHVDDMNCVGTVVGVYPDGTTYSVLFDDGMNDKFDRKQLYKLR